MIVTQNALANALSMGRNARQSKVLPRREFLNEQGLIFGACYKSTAVVPDGTPRVVVDDPVTEYVPSARPGGRAPHVWLTRGDEQISTVDLFGPHFVLLAGATATHGGGPRKRSARRGRRSWPLPSEQDGDLGDPDGNWHEAYGVDTDGAVLVRPDGHVAWRSRSGASQSAGRFARGAGSRVRQDARHRVTLVRSPGRRGTGTPRRRLIREPRRGTATRRWNRCPDDR